MRCICQSSGTQGPFRPFPLPCHSSVLCRETVLIGDPREWSEVYLRGPKGIPGPTKQMAVPSFLGG